MIGDGKIQFANLDYYGEDVIPYLCDERILSFNFFDTLNKPETAKELDDVVEGLIETGKEAGEYARKYIENTFSATRRDDKGNINIEAQIEATKFAMEQEYKCIAEASFLYEDLFCAVDLLVKDGDGWAIYEVKGSSSYKEEHLYDVAFQKYVLCKCGIKVNHTYLMHLNKNYVRKGEIDVLQLFAFEPIDEHKEILIALENIEYSIPDIRNVINSVCYF